MDHQLQIQTPQHPTWLCNQDRGVNPAPKQWQKEIQHRIEQKEKKREANLLAQGVIRSDGVNRSQGIGERQKLGHLPHGCLFGLDTSIVHHHDDRLMKPYRMTTLDAQLTTQSRSLGCCNPNPNHNHSSSCLITYLPTSASRMRCQQSCC